MRAEEGLATSWAEFGWGLGTAAIAVFRQDALRGVAWAQSAVATSQFFSF